MSNKILKRVIFLSILLSFVFGIAWVFAQDPGTLEITYPTTTGVRPPRGVTTFLPRYIKYIYHFLILTGGLIALLALIYGGFRFMTSAGNPAAIKDAREQILAGFLGLVILLGSYVVLNELNPDLVSLRIPRITSVRSGVIVYSQPECGKAQAVDYPDIPELLDLDENEIKYKALRATGSSILGEDEKHIPNLFPVSLYSFNSSTDLTIQLYGNKECEGENPLATITDLRANECYPYTGSLLSSLPDNIQCIKFVWYIPGVWVFNKLDNSSGTEEVPNPKNLPTGWSEGRDYIVFQSSQDALPGIFHDNIKAIAIVPDKKLERNYGAILHNLDGGLMHNKGWARIYLPGVSSQPGKAECTTDGAITMCGPFNQKYSAGWWGFFRGTLDDVSSITVFTTPTQKIGPPTHSIQVCRENRCEPQKVGNKFYDAYLWLTPEETDELSDETGQFGSGGKGLYFDGEDTLYAHSFKKDKWDTGKKVVLGKSQADGISAVTIEKGAHYLVLLYEEHFSDFKDINSPKHFVEAVILNQSMPSAITVDRWDGRTGTIVVIRTHSESD